MASKLNDAVATRKTLAISCSSHKSPEMTVRATADHTGTVDNGETGQDVARSFEAKKAGRVKLIAAKGKDSRTVPIKITPNDDGTFAVTFNPKLFPDTYTIAVTWVKEEDAIPANKVGTVNHPVLLPEKPEAPLLDERQKNAITIIVGTPLKINVRLKDDTQRNGTLTATVQGDATGSANVQTTQNAEEGVFEVYFNPPEPDYYVLEVKLNNEQVSQSPFHVLYIQAELVPQVNPKLLADSKVADEGVTNLVSQQTTCTIIKKEIHKRTTIEAGKTTQVNKDDKMTELSNTPRIIDIIMKSTPLPQEQAKHVIPKLASNCTASGEGLKKARVGQSAKFSVDCSQGGAGELHVTVQGPNNEVPFKIQKTKSQNFDVTYTPEEVDSHNISISWGKEQIPDSPFQCSVIDPSQCSVQGELSQATVNTRQTFVVDTSKAGPGELSVKCTGPKGSQPQVEINGTSKMFECAWIPQEMGPHEIKITLSGYSIPKNPLQVNALRYADSESCIVSELPKGDLYIRKLYSFTVNTQQPGYTCDLTILPTPEESLASCTVNGNQSKGVYTVAFSPVEVGDLALIVKCNGSAIPTHKKPLSFYVIDPTKPIKELCEFQVMENIETVNIPAELLGNNVDFTEEDATPSTSDVVQDMVCEVNKTLILLIDLESDQIGRDITATITGQKTKLYSVPVTKNPDNSVTVRVSAKEPDRYTITLQVDGEPLPTGPFFVTFIEPIKIQGQTEKQTVTLQQSHQEERVMKLSYNERKLINAQVSLSVDSSQANASNPSVAILKGTTGHLIPATLSQLEGGKYNIEFLTTNEREYVMKFEYQLKIAPIAQDKHYVLSVI